MIKIENLSFFYKKHRMIYDNVSLEMKSGIYGLLGENGVGKTSLLHLISGLRFPKTGKCEVLGYTAAQRNPAMLQQLFFLPEEVDTPSVSIQAYADLNSKFYPEFSKELFEEYLNEFGLDKTQKLTEQSLGQKKKAMIAFALALNTPILLLDEPTNGLDIPSKTQFRKILASIYTEERCIVISSHQVRDLANLIDPIIILDYNDVLLNHSIEEISSKLKFSYSFDKPEKYFYLEQSMQGFASVTVNIDQSDSVVDIEALFNAVVNNKKEIKELFKA